MPTNKNYKKCMFIILTQSEIVSKITHAYFSALVKISGQLRPLSIFVYSCIFSNNDQKVIQNVIMIKIFFFG